MSKRFIAQVARLTPGTHYTRAGYGTFNPGDYAKKKLPHMRGTALFTYCFRRFGYPTSGWDGDKELASYTITTPEPDVFLGITPHVSGQEDAWLSFGYVVEQAIDEQERSIWRQGGYDTWEQSPLYKRCAKALERAINDLLRPVYVRDVPINCCGPVGDTAKLLAEVEPYHAAGYGIPGALLDDETRYNAFLDAMGALGNGNFGRGMEAVIALAKVREQEEEAQP